MPARRRPSTCPIRAAAGRERGFPRTPRRRRDSSFVAGVDVTPRCRPLGIAAMGGSITEGFASTADANHRWTDDLAIRLFAANACRPGLPTKATAATSSSSTDKARAASRASLETCSTTPASRTSSYRGDQRHRHLGRVGRGPYRRVYASDRRGTRRGRQGLGRHHLLRSKALPTTPRKGKARAQPSMHGSVRAARSTASSISMRRSATRTPRPSSCPLTTAAIRFIRTMPGYQAMADAVDLSLFD